MDELLEQDDNKVLLAEYAERAYLEYAVSVVKGRALPDVCDGQKPVQRRILFSMRQMGLAANAKPVKSARVVGDVLGKFHPHGDASAYDAMVRLAQQFSMRYPLIDGQGNFGSRDGDGAAAMRYTEARLTPIAELLLEELDQGTVDFGPNYDGSFEEPMLLPARLPFVLLNGASGIAVGMATDIPSHNLNEVAQASIALIKNPELSDQKIAELIPGPDFPCGGQIISSPHEIALIYATGRGSIKVRSRWQKEELARGQWQIVVDELPPNTSTQKILEEIEELSNPKIKSGKKSLSQHQINQRQMLMSLVDTIRDESSKDAAVRLVLEPKSKNTDPDELMNFLLSHTNLESSVSMNFVAVGLDGRPKQKTLREMIVEWIAFRTQAVKRRLGFRRDKVLRRIHILEGREIVFLNIDEVIAIIREADDPKRALMERFSLSDMQAEDILEIRLRQLARLEGIKIEQELMGLRDELNGLTELLSNDDMLSQLLIKEIKEDAKKFGDDRRTLIETAERAVVQVAVVDDPITIIISKNGWVRARSGHQIDIDALGFKQGDGLAIALHCRTIHPLIAMDHHGRCYTVATSQIPTGRGDGVPLTSMIECQDGGRLSAFVAGSPETRVVVATHMGLGFTCSIQDLMSRQKAGKAFLSLQTSDQILCIKSYDVQDTHLACLSTDGRLLNLPMVQVKALPSGGKGIILMAFNKNQTMLSAEPNQGIALDVFCLGVDGAGDVVRIQGVQMASFEGERARKGKQLDGKTQFSGLMAVDADQLISRSKGGDDAE